MYCRCQRSQVFEPPLGTTSNLHRRKKKAQISFAVAAKLITDQLRRSCEADQHLCFHYMDSTIPLLSKSKISSL